MDLVAIDCFVKVAEARSLSEASKHWRVPKSTLSHKSANSISSLRRPFRS